MAKSQQPMRAEKYPYPSVFGSHKSMVVKEDEDGVHCTCADEFGEYVTEIKRLDNGCSDPNRYAQSRIGKLFAGREKEDKK